MPVTDVRKNTDKLTLTITAEFEAPVERAWQLWADPRQLERWWGPPTYPATVVDHDLVPGGRVKYFMTGPEGDKHGGWWRIVAVDAPRSLVFEDGFSDDDGEPNDDMPVTTSTVALSDRDGGGTRMVITAKFPSAAAMEQMVQMGMEEGLREAMGQIDAILAS
jgi:uncharacterized protein YndB with AHSA1/START domain